MTISQATRVAQPSVAELYKIVHAQVADLDDADYMVLRNRFNQSRTSDAGYTGPDPQPILDTIAARIRAHGVPVTFDTDKVTSYRPDQTLDDGQLAQTWGYYDIDSNQLFIPHRRHRARAAPHPRPRGRARAHPTPPAPEPRLHRLHTPTDDRHHVGLRGRRGDR